MANPRFETLDYVASPPAGTGYTLTDDLLPALPSDDFTQDLPRKLYQTRHTRNGATVAAYNLGEARIWRFSLRNAPLADIQALRTFWFARIFNFYPDASVPGTVYTVEWVDEDFLPENQPGDSYSLSLTLQEIVT